MHRWEKGMLWLKVNYIHLYVHLIKSFSNSFVEYTTDAEVQSAVDQFDGQDFKGSNLKVMVGAIQSSSGPSQSFQNTNWNNASMEPTSRIPREERFSRPPMYGTLFYKCFLTTLSRLTSMQNNFCFKYLTLANLRN